MFKSTLLPLSLTEDDIEEELDALPAAVEAKLASAVMQARDAADRSAGSSTRAQAQSEIAWGYSSNSTEEGALPPPSKKPRGSSDEGKQRSGFGATADDEDESSFMASWEKDEF